MKNTVHDLADYAFRKDDVLLLDTNVWLYLNPAPSDRSPGTSSLTRQYSEAFKSMLSAGAPLIMDALVLSEYLNRYCRIEWNALHKREHPCFKTFRKSSAFAEVGGGAAVLARSMLRLCVRCDPCFAAGDIDGVLADFETGSSDFNDRLLTETCRRNGWKLVTHDRDFMTGGIEVLTMNRMLLDACA